MVYFRLLPALVAASFALSWGTVSAQPIPESEVSLLQEMVRFLTGSNQETQILPGQLPNSLPEELPLPEGAETVGSILRNSDSSARILLKVAQSLEEVFSSYQQQLLDANWQYLDSNSTNQGFLAVEPSEDTGDEMFKYASYCSPSESSLLLISLTSTQPQSNSQTLVEVELLESFNSGLQDSPVSICSQSGIDSPLPNLPPPADAFIGSGSNDGFRSDVEIESDLDAKALIDHYNRQFQQTNWTQIDSGEGELLQWSLWNFEDEQGRNWQGLLTITEVQNVPGQYSAYVQVIEQLPNN
ncbi:hypothetical protein H6F93_29560 [Leptolyngbya sp. FACHB-671]|uniref:hypothetical protein n=1 Tax=Leptolyngbya sp. FACHB-671 TaxID=2692812 RepID=UPI0016832408|nr:hypothetical protein [Leptolyngbya sp. FACHB-671]MBD2071618.1 hypothetical protein [Leptolyngbya sp. FACHB-671]